MGTQVYRVTQVLTAAGSPVARLQANNEEGHNLRLELPTQLVERAKPGHVLVLNWSLHALPGHIDEAAAQSPIAAATAPPASATAPPTSAASPRAIDEAFMGLMSRVRPGPSAASATPPVATTPPASQMRSGTEINDEFNKLLGSPRTKG
jgi:hypothetical protein